MNPGALPPISTKGEACGSRQAGIGTGSRMTQGGRPLKAEHLAGSVINRRLTGPSIEVPRAPLIPVRPETWPVSLSYDWVNITDTPLCSG